MKKLIFLFALAAITTATNAQGTQGTQGTQGSGSQSTMKQNPQSPQTDVPDAVNQSFMKAYPNTTNVDWLLMDDNSYRATWDGTQKGMSAYYDRSGKLTASGNRITVDKLPTTVTKYVNDNYQGRTISNASKVTSTTGNVWYSVRVDQTDMKFDAKGAPILK